MRGKMGLSGSEFQPQPSGCSLQFWQSLIVPFTTNVAGLDHRFSNFWKACLKNFYKIFLISIKTMQYVSNNILFKHSYHLVFTSFTLAQSLQEQDILRKSYFSYNVKNHRQAFLIFHVEVLEFPQLMFWANKNIQMWKAGSFWNQLIYFTTLLFANIFA